MTSVVVVQASALDGLTTTQLADYAAMRAFVRTDPAKLRSAATDRLVWQAVFAEGEAKEAARWLLWELGQVTGARPASIHGPRAYDAFCEFAPDDDQDA